MTFLKKAIEKYLKVQFFCYLITRIYSKNQKILFQVFSVQSIENALHTVK